MMLHVGMVHDLTERRHQNWNLGRRKINGSKVKTWKVTLWKVKSLEGRE